MTCSVGTLNNGDSQTITLTVQPGPAAVGAITNQADVSSTEPDADLSNNMASVPTTVNPLAALSVEKTSAPNPAFLGDPLTYTVVVTNAGPSDATGAVMTDTLPGGATFNSASAGCSEAGGVVACSIGALASGVVATRTIVVTPNTLGPITNTAAVAGNEFDPALADNTTSDIATVIPTAALSVAKSDTPSLVFAGDALTYTIAVTNSGPLDATNTTLTDTLPASLTGATWTCVAGTNSNCDTANGTGDINEYEF